MKFPKARTYVLCAFLVLPIALWAGGAQENTHSSNNQETAAMLHEGEKPMVVATTSIITDVVSRIGGEHIELKMLIPRGQNPHSYQPNPRQIADIEKAHLVFTNGLDLEEEILTIIEHNATCPIIEVSHGVDIIKEEIHDHDGVHVEHDEHHHHDEENMHEENEHHHNHSMGDPHTWTSPINVLFWVDNIERALSSIDPANENEYKKAAALYRNELTSVDEEIRKTLSVIPQKKRVIVTDHQAFGYFARDYNFEVIGTILPSFSSNAEASARHLAELLDILEHDEVTALFIDSAANYSIKKLAQTLSEESGRQIEILQLLSGTLTAPGNEGDSYIGYLRFNAAQLVKGLTTK